MSTLSIFHKISWIFVVFTLSTAILNDADEKTTIWTNNKHRNIQFPNEDQRRICQKKCDEYKRISYTSHYEQAIPLLIDPKVRIDIRVNRCNLERWKNPLIFGGTKSGPGEFPFMVALGYETATGRKFLCGGTLISERFILTAAHCIIISSQTTHISGPDVVRFFTGTKRMDFEDIPIEKYLIHPKYKSPIKYHDLALIQLQRQIAFDDFIWPACLDYPNRPNFSKFTKNVWATGWGQRNSRNLDGMTASRNLMKVQLKIYPKFQCDAVYKHPEFLPMGILSKYMICAGDLEGQRDTCKGDSGGPIFIPATAQDQCNFYVIGITSFGKSCGQFSTPAIYTRISTYISWIEENVWI